MEQPGLKIEISAHR
jgi:hypothetical protein